MGTWENPLCLSLLLLILQQIENIESEIRPNSLHQALGTILLLATATQGVSFSLLVFEFIARLSQTTCDNLKDQDLSLQLSRELQLSRQSLVSFDEK